MTLSHPHDDLIFHVRPGQPAERAAGRMLLADQYRVRAEPQLFVAVTEPGHHVIAAAVLSKWPCLSEPPGFRFAIRVAEPYRRRGVGQALVQCAAEHARRLGHGTLYLWTGLAENDPQLPAWTGLGFTGRQTLNQYEMDLEQAMTVMEPIYQRMISRNRIPAEAKVIPLRDAPIQPVIRMYRQHFTGRPRRLVSRIRGHGPDPFEPDLSKVLLLGNRVVGVLLDRWETLDVGIVDAMVIDPELRGGWANLLLKMAVAKDSMQAGCRTIRFNAHDIHRDTRRAAERIGSTMLKSKVILYRPADSP